MKRLPLLLAGIVALLALGLFLRIVTEGFQAMAKVEIEREELCEEKARLETRIEELDATLRALRSSPEAVESMARRDLGLVRPGERVILIAEPRPQPRPEMTEPLPTPILRLPDQAGTQNGPAPPGAGS